MSISERHVADVCATCKGGREIHVNFATRKLSVSLPESCTARPDCEKALKDAAELEQAGAQ